MCVSISSHTHATKSFIYSLIVIFNAFDFNQTEEISFDELVSVVVLSGFHWIYLCHFAGKFGAIGFTGNLSKIKHHKGEESVCMPCPHGKFQADWGRAFCLVETLAQKNIRQEEDTKEPGSHGHCKSGTYRLKETVKVPDSPI